MRPLGAFAPLLGAFALVLSACASAPPREPVVRTVTVSVPIAIPCRPDLDAAPAYPDTAKALKEAADLFERVKILLAGRELRIARVAAVEGALKACGAER